METIPRTQPHYLIAQSNWQNEVCFGGYLGATEVVLLFE
jgi:hypothetical protein